MSSKSHNGVWREVHRSPTKLGHRIFQCKWCGAAKTTKPKTPKKCEFCGYECVGKNGVIENE